MKRYLYLPILFATAFGCLKASASCESSFFINAVKALRPLGVAFKAAEADLQRQGYVSEPTVSVQRQASGTAGVDIFEIQQTYRHPTCGHCPEVRIQVRGQQRTNPPAPGERDLFQVDSLVVTNR